jgi:hypothetical protein
MIDWENTFLRYWKPYFWITLAGLLVFGKTLLFSFVHYDDIYLLDNARLFGYLPEFPKIFMQGLFLRGITTIYRPMLAASFIFDYWIGGYDPAMYHLTNLVLHLMTSGLIFLLLQKLGYKNWLALIFSLIFSVHPATANTVAWISGRNDSLIAVFTLSSFIFLTDYWKQGQIRGYAWHIFFFALALLTKETAVVIPILFFFYLFLDSNEKPSFQKIQVLLVGWLLTLICWALIKQAALSSSAQLTVFGSVKELFINFPNNVFALIQYIGRAILPINLSKIAFSNQTDLTYGFLSIILFIIIGAFSRPKRFRMAAFGAAWFILFLLPTFGNKTSFLMDNRLYLPMFGIILLLLEANFIRSIKTGAILGLITIAIFRSVIFIKTE